MSETRPVPPQELDHSAGLRGRVLGGGVALLASTGVLAPPAFADSDPLATGATVGLHPAEFGSANTEFPTTAETSMRRDTVYLKNLHCSGKALRNKDGKVIGVLTAQHCNLQDGDNQRISGADGNNYIIQPKPILAQTGSRYKHLKTVAEIDRFIVPGKSTTTQGYDTTKDIALGVAKGHTPEEVSKAYDQSALSQKEIQNLRVGQTIYMSGWPVYRAKGNHIVNEREAFKMSALAIGYSNSTKTHEVKTLWAKTTSTKDGATCSYGASGSEGFIMVDGKPKSVGTLSYFYDLKGKIPGGFAPAGQSLPDLRLRGSITSAVCGFAFEAPQLNKDAMILKSVRSGDQIPGYTSPEQSDAKARALVRDPSYQRTVLDGKLTIPTLKGGPTTTGTYFDIVDDPILVHDAKDKTTVVFWAEPDATDHLASRLFKDDELSNLSAYPHETGGAEPGLVVSNGSLQYEIDMSGSTFGDIADPNLGKIAVKYAKDPGVSGYSYVLSVDGGNLSVSSPKSMK